MLKITWINEWTFFYVSLFPTRGWVRSWRRASTWEYTWREEAAPGSSTSSLLMEAGMKTTGELTLIPVPVSWKPHCIPTKVKWFVFPLCTQSVWAGRRGHHRGPGQPGVCERSHCGLQPGADPLHLPSAQESSSWSWLLLWQLLLGQTITLPSCYLH